MIAAVLPGAAPASTPGLVVSLTFDDGYANHATAAAPILAAHGMQGTFFVPSGFVGSSGYMTWSQVSALAAAGNEIGGHTVDHPDLTSVSAAQARQEICADRNTLLQQGLSVTDFAYPYGKINAAVESIVQECGYNSARTTSWYGSTCGRPCTESIPPRDPYATTIVAFGGAQTLADIENNIMAAETHGGWAQILIHRVCDSCGSNAMSPDGSERAARLACSRVPRRERSSRRSPRSSAARSTHPLTRRALFLRGRLSLALRVVRGSVALQWSAPVSDGGSAITGYNVYRGTASGGESLLAQVGNVTSYTDASVTNGTTYFYEVSAVNAVGESALSDELSATAAGRRA